MKRIWFISVQPGNLTLPLREMEMEMEMEMGMEMEMVRKHRYLSQS
jgi:hypothetical protein